jgi:hypothetical protein
MALGRYTVRIPVLRTLIDSTSALRVHECPRIKFLFQGLPVFVHGFRRNLWMANAKHASGTTCLRAGLRLRQVALSENQQRMISDRRIRYQRRFQRRMTTYTAIGAVSGAWCT